jgi:hypothetical protein
MRMLEKVLSLGLLTAAVGAASGCNSDYALFNIHPHFALGISQNDRQPIESCKLTITDEKGGKVVDGYMIQPKKISESKQVGCGLANTPADIGNLSYSTSLSAGTLTFTVDGLDNSKTVKFSGSAQGTIKVFHSPNDEVGVDIVIDRK